MESELPIIELPRREREVQASGFEVRNPADEKMYPVAGQGVKKRTTPRKNLLPVIDVQHLTSAPSLKTWLGQQEGKPLRPEHEPIIASLKTARKNGAPINLNVNPDGYYDLAFSGANGNMVRIEDFWKLRNSGLSLGETLRSTKLVCGQNGFCGNPGPCGVCLDIRNGCYEDSQTQAVQAPSPKMLTARDSLDEEINLLVEGGRDYRIHGNRIVSMRNSKSADIGEVRTLCKSMAKSVIYVLEMLGVFRDTEATSTDALKRIDLGGH